MTRQAYTAIQRAKLEIGSTIMLGDYTLMRECIIWFPPDTVPFLRLSDTAQVIGCLFVEQGPVPAGGLKPLKWEVPPGSSLWRADGTHVSVEIQEALR